MGKRLAKADDSVHEVLERVRANRIEGNMITDGKGIGIAATVGSVHDFPMADRDRSWDAAAANTRWREHTNSTEEPSAAYRDGFLWYDAENSDQFGAYKLQVVDVIDGETHYVPRAVFATAGGRGVDAADIPTDDKDRVKATICGLYEKVNAASDDEELDCPFDEDSTASLAVLLASLEPGSPITGAIFQTGTGYVVYLAPVGRFTGDDRIIFDLGWREGRLPLTFSDSEMGHFDAVHVGNMENFRYEDVEGVQWVVADVEFDTDEVAQDAKRMVDEEKLRGVSVHLGAGWAVLFCRDNLSETPSKEEVMAAAEAAVADDEVLDDCLRWALGIFEAEIGAATIVVIPAFEDAHVEPVLAAAQEIADLMSPPREWFEDPGLDRPSGIRIDREGRVTGHLAFWDSCHRGFGECVLAPRGLTYDQFHQNAVLTLSDEELGVGCLTLDVNHADTKLPLESARDHYDHSGTVFAFVRAGEDEHGVWVSGALAPGLEPEKVEIARRMRLSGDWRPKDGSYELIAAQSVPVPGFVPRTLVASGELQTLGPEASEFADTSDMGLVASALAATTAVLAEVRGELARLNARNEEEALREELAGLFDPETATP